MNTQKIQDQDHPDLLTSVSTTRVGSMHVYATAAGAFSAIPVPFLDDFLSGLARGAAMRRVAKRHNIQLSPEARRVLARAGVEPSMRQGLRVVRSVLSRLLAPLRILSQLDQATEPLLAAFLLDYYLRNRDRLQHTHTNSTNSSTHATMCEEEAQRIRDAIRDSTLPAVRTTLTQTPSAVLEALQSTYKAMRMPRHEDPEHRALFERTIDTLLDQMADAPERISDDLQARFDAALQHQPI